MGNQVNSALEALQRTTKPFDMKNWILTKLIQWINSKAGAFVQSAIGAGLGWLASKLLQIGLNVPEKLWADITETSMGIGAFIVIAATQWVQAHYNLKVQGALGVEQDAWIGPQTVRKAEIVREILDTTHTP